MIWFQRRFSVGPFRRGFHLITREAEQCLSECPAMEVGLCHLFLLHTSASLTINENADPDVQIDLESSINSIAPENFPYVHTMEGPDDMPAHVKCSLLGAHLTVPISRQQLVLGTWQGIYLCEHRDRAAKRNLVLTAYGATEAS